jgi:adenylyl- and sulfurtransferase ThiI
MTRVLALISAGIDSPVAAWKMKQLGLEVIGIHFSNEPLAFSSPREKTIEICMHLHIPRLYIVKHGVLVQAELMRKCDKIGRAHV